MLVDVGLIYGLWHKASRKKIDSVFLSAVDANPAHSLPYRIRNLDSLGVIVCDCFDLTMLGTNSQVQALIKKTKIIAEKQLGSKDYCILESSIKNRISSAWRGVEQFGLELPMTFVLAIDTQEKTQHQSNHSLAFNDISPSKPSYSPHDYLKFINIDISDDHQVATISIDPNIYENIKDFSLNDIENLIADKGILWQKERAETLIPYIKNKQAVSNLPITMGVSPNPGDQPIIEMIAMSPNSTLQAAAKKIVQSQSAHTLVFAGETFGRISHRIKPKRGFNLFGEPLRAKPNYPDILIGSGVLVQANDSLVAAVDGYLYSNEKDLWISPVSIIDSTKIDQRKPIKVHGDTIIIGDLDQNVDIVGTGSIVATGTIICKKMIINGNLFVNGGLRCSEETDRVVVRGDLIANYIVSGVHFISKNLRVTKGVMEATLVIGGRLDSRSVDSHIFGSTIYCREGIRCFHLGKNAAAPTEVQLGSHFKTTARMIKLELRLAFVIKRFVETNKTTNIKQELSKTYRNLKRELRNKAFEEIRWYCEIYGTVTKDSQFKTKFGKKAVSIEQSMVQLTEVVKSNGPHLELVPIKAKKAKPA